MDTIRSDMLMYVCSMVFGWIITYIFKARLVIELEVSLRFAIQ